MSFKHLTLLLLGLWPCAIQAQIGGLFTFDFLELPATARTAGLGGVNISSTHRDPAMFLANPALLQDSVAEQLGLSLMAYYAGTSYTSLSYARELGKTGRWGFGLQRMGYGQMEAYDPSGQSLGSFRASDVALSLSKSHQIGPFAIGAALRFAQSSLESYRSSALLWDLGGAFFHPKADLKVGLTIRNIGWILQRYSPTDGGGLPTNVLLGASFKPNQMPFRLSLTAQHLHRLLNLAYDDPAERQTTNLFGDVENNELGFADKLSRHFVIASEVIISPGFNLRVGYNFLQRSEMRLDDIAGAAGFSIGIMLRIKRLEIAYSRNWQHLAGGANMFSFAFNTHQLIRPRAKPLLE